MSGLTNGFLRALLKAFDPAPGHDELSGRFISSGLMMPILAELLALRAERKADLAREMTDATTEALNQ